MKNILVAGSFVIIPESTITPENLYQGAVALRAVVGNDPSRYHSNYSFLAIAPEDLERLKPISQYELDEALRDFLNPKNLNAGAPKMKIPSGLSSIMKAMQEGYHNINDMPYIPLYALRRKHLDGKSNSGSGEDVTVHMPEELKQLLRQLPEEAREGILRKMEKDMDLSQEQLAAIRKSFESSSKDDDDEDEDDLARSLGITNDDDEDDEEEDLGEPIEGDNFPCFDCCGPFLILRGPTQEVTHKLFSVVRSQIEADLVISESIEGSSLGGSALGSSVIKSATRMDLTYKEIEAALHETEGSSKPLSDAEMVDKFLSETNWA